MNENSSDSKNDNGPAPSVLMLWSQYIEGQPLSQEQRSQLQTALHADPAFRQTALDERWLDGILRLESENDQEAEAFVNRVLQRCQGKAPKSFPSEVTSRSGLGHPESNGTLSGFMQAVDSSVEKPPAVTIRTGNLSNSKRKQSLRWRWSSSNAAVAWVVASLLLIVGFSGWGLWHYAQSSGGAGQPSSAIAGHSKESGNQISSIDSTISDPIDSAGVTEPLFATLTAIKHSDEEDSLQVGQTFGQQPFDLDAGEVQFTMASGVVVEVFAPSRIEFVTENSLLLHSGELSATVPPKAYGFQVITPSVVVTDLGTVFDVGVEVNGTTEVEVRQGSVFVSSREESTQQQWTLDAEETYQLTFYAPAVFPSLPPGDRQLETPMMLASYPIASLGKNRSGELAGVISLGGRSLKFDDELVFATVRDRLFRGVQDSPEQYIGRWHQFVESTLERPQPEGTMMLNGLEFSFGNFNEVVRLQNQLQQQFAPFGQWQQGNDDRNPRQQEIFGGFRGTLIINGQRRDFDSAAEYQAALKELLGPAADFGFFP
ncbi:MAG: FecR domain-containing protein [Pirellulaceae bacterium]|nr:FecR domain-containing protein [Pirellulaceae bacterium]